MNSREKIIFGVIFLFPLLFVGVVYYSTCKPSIDFINNNSFKITEFTDRNDNGNSTSEIRKTGSDLFVTYTLKEGYSYPYAGIEIHKSDYSYFPLDNYKFKFLIDASDDLRLSVRISQYLKDYTKTGKYLSYLILVKSFGLKKGLNEIEINANDINEIPDWWFIENPEKINNVDSHSLDKTRSVWLFSENATPKDKVFTLNIHGIKLEYNTLAPLYKYLYLLIAYYILLLLFIWRRQKVKIKYMPIEAIKIKNKIPQTQANMLEFIGKNYSNPDLKLSDVALHTGISEDMTSDLLKKYSNKSFRQYLNQIRMEEAKRLLKESDLQISEIAFNVGYNNIQHFNRVFKEYTGQSPKAYRES